MIYTITALIFIAVAASMIYAWSSLAPWVPTPFKDLERVNTIANLKPGQTFLEIGCGNGRVCSYIAKNNPKVQVIGIELAYFFYLFTKIRTALLGPKNLSVTFGDALKYDISDIDVLFIYGTTKAINGAIKQKITQEMRPSSKLISYGFTIKEWNGRQTTYKESDKATCINVYEI